MQHCQTPLTGNFDEAADLLTAMANPKRLEILCKLLEAEMTVGELARQLDLSQSALSQHLAKLRKRRLVKTRRSAQQLFYSIDSEDVVSIMATLQDIFREQAGKRSGA